jgi:hypothetical protein
MQSKIESNTKFEAEIKGNPIKLLKILKQHALNYHEHHYEMSIILDSMRALFNLKRKEGESQQDYTKCSKTAQDVLKSHIGGPILLAKTVSSMDGYDEDNKPKIEAQMNEAYNQLLAFTYLKNSDKTKYGSLLSSLQTQHSLKNSQYPQTITEETNVLSNHRFDTVGKNDNKKSSNSSDKTAKDEEKPEMSFAMLEGKVLLL